VSVQESGIPIHFNSVQDDGLNGSESARRSGDLNSNYRISLERCRTDRVMSSEQNKYLRDIVHKIPGWLEDYTAIRTMDMLDWQVNEGIRGSLIEIGVCNGRYFSILLRSANQTGEQVVGLDTFQWVNEEIVRAAVNNLSIPPPIFIRKPSTQCSARELMGILKAPPRFFSIDGSHDYEDVFWDLRLAEDILSPGGIIAADDFLNPMTLGVNEAVNAFFSTPRSLAPFAYIANKLFLCRPPMASKMMEMIENYVRADQLEPRSATFRENDARDRNSVEVTIWRRRLLIIP